MSVPPLSLDHVTIRKILPHTGQALVIDTVEIESTTAAKGYFLVLADDPRITSHFNVMPGVLIAEFCHLTGAVLLMHDAKEPIVPALNETFIRVTEAVLPGDDLLCKVTLTEQEHRTFSFAAVVCKVHSQKLVATVSFRGTRVPKSIFDRQMRRHAAILA